MLKGEKVTYETDIFSIGIIMWQLKVGKVPYCEISFNEIVAYRVVKFNLRPDRCQNYLKEEMCSKKLFKEKKAFKVASPLKLKSKTKILKKSNILSHSGSVKIKKVIPQILINDQICRSLISTKDFHAIRTNKSQEIPSETVSSQTLKIESNKIQSIKTPKQASPFHQTTFLDLIFKSFHNENALSYSINDIENLYEQLYIKCWNSEIRCRPKSSDLIKEVSQLLKPIGD